MQRRQFIKASVVSSIAIVGIGSGIFYSVGSVDKEELTIAVALKKLEQLSTQKIQHNGEWDGYKIFAHCAQSVEFSMSAFPQHKSSLFKRTLGDLAFSAFKAKGQMAHSLNEVIPGAPAITANLDPMIAINRLKQSLIDFDNYTDKLAPHFAYGELTKREYEIAHVMHLNNHLQEINSLPTYP